MIAEHDWPHDWAMVVPQTNEKEKAIPLFDDLLQRIDPILSNDSEDGSWEGWRFQNKIDETAE